MDEILRANSIYLEKDKRTIIKNLTFSVPRYSISAILGRNGAGKSSLASVLMGLSGFKPTGGRVYFEGEDITDLSVTDRAKRGLTLAWQTPASFEGMKVSEYIMLGSKDKNGKVLKEALDRIDLDTTYYTKRILDKSLSGGERKRIELAAVFAMQPKLVILDEPDSGIDAISLDKIKQLIINLRDRGTTILLITHREEIVEIADRAYLIGGGEIVKDGSPSEVVNFFKTECDKCFHRVIPEEFTKEV
jgi:Fe-S cluster assembly ATP-binding protein